MDLAVISLAQLRTVVREEVRRVLDERESGHTLGAARTAPPALDWLPAAACCEALNVSSSTLRRYRRRYGLTHVRLGQKVFYSRREIEALMVRLATTKLTE